MATMHDTISQLQGEIVTLQGELATLQNSKEKLINQCSSFRMVVNFASNSTLEGLAEFHQHNCIIEEEWFAEIQDLTRLLSGVETQIKQKQALLDSKQTVLDKLQAQKQWQELELTLQMGRQRLLMQSQKVNQLTLQLERELQTLKVISEEVNPLYCQWLQKSANIVEYSAKTIPYVLVSGQGLEVANKDIDWQNS
jgi:paraquat-inducible protein B